jgi:hypothetical protein
LPHSQFETGQGVDEMMGFIMCEAGLDNIRGRLVFQRREEGDEPDQKKRKKKPSAADDDNNVNVRQSGCEDQHVVINIPEQTTSVRVSEARGVASAKDADKCTFLRGTMNYVIIPLSCNEPW